MCLSIVIYTPICLRKKYGLFLYSNVASKSLYSFYKVRKCIKSHWDDRHLTCERGQRTVSGTSWLAENIPFAVGTLRVKGWSGRVQLPTHYAWRHTGLQKWTKSYNYVQCFGIVDLIPLMCFIYDKCLHLPPKEPSHIHNTHIKKKKSHFSYTYAFL